MSPVSKIGKKLEKARKELDLSQAQVAEKVGINANYYARIERGVVNPSLKTLQQILKVLK